MGEIDTIIISAVVMVAKLAEPIRMSCGLTPRHWGKGDKERQSQMGGHMSAHASASSLWDPGQIALPLRAS